MTRKACVLLSVVICGCGAGGGFDGSGGSGGRGGFAPSSPPTGGGSDAGAPVVPAGELTAGAWDDNANFARFEPWAKSKQGLPGAPRVEIARVAAAGGPAATALDVAIVLDTTGSMGDEIKYLRDEITSISKEIAARFPGVSQRWGLVVYRDRGDEYVSRAQPFTGDVSEFQRTIAVQRADGGGDYPEAPEVGLRDASQLSWRDGAEVARMAFWVADAPHHDGAENALVDAIKALAARDVRIYPVAASGADEMTEYDMRLAAQVTGGRYLFLTDDSGIGGAHIEPKVPCYVVTKWKAQMVRMIAMELTRKHIVAEPGEVIRSVGMPVDGRCALQDGASAELL